MSYSDSSLGQVVRRHLIVLISPFFHLGLGKLGKYGGTVFGPGFVVLFRHCLWESSWAAWGCVGKVCANNLSPLVLSFWHPADTSLQA